MYSTGLLIEVLSGTFPGKEKDSILEANLKGVFSLSLSLSCHVRGKKKGGGGAPAQFPESQSSIKNYLSGKESESCP